MLAERPNRSRPDFHHMTMKERRARNRSLSSLLCSPPPYPGYYTSCLGSINRAESKQLAFVQYGDHKKVPPSSFHRSASQSRACPLRTPSGSPPLCSPEDDSEFQFSADEEVSKKSSCQMAGSSGYGSGGSESEHDYTERMMTQSYLEDDVIETRRRNGRRRTREEEETDKWRRRSMPAPARTALPQDALLVLASEGYVQYETNVDSGDRMAMEVRGIRRPESVMQLARRFGEIGAAQQNDLHKSKSSLVEGKENRKGTTRSGPPTPTKQAVSDRLGGIASLTAPPAMSRPNMFKQMEKVGSGTSEVKRPMNPGSIKEALLKWCQSKVQGYPNVNVTNFSSSWADGMAFCALIHRFAPNAFDFNQLTPQNRRHNFELAFRVAEEHGVCQLLEVDDMIMMGDRPDWKCVFTYVQGFYKEFRNRP